jgi:hypothetical protein
MIKIGPGIAKIQPKPLPQAFLHYGYIHTAREILVLALLGRRKVFIYAEYLLTWTFGYAVF